MTKKPNRNRFYDIAINKMVNEALAQKEEEFAQKYADASDEELLEYLRQKIKELKHTPWPKEVVGWKFITERFGSWPEAVHKTELPIIRTPNKPNKFQLYLEEVEIQKKVYRANRAEKKAKAVERNKEKIHSGTNGNRKKIRS